MGRIGGKTEQGQKGERPLPPPEGIAKPSGNHASSKLSGFYKIKLKNLGYRVVYNLVCDSLNDIIKQTSRGKPGATGQGVPRDISAGWG